MQRSLSFLAYFFICTAAAAQQYPFVYYTPREGLVNSRVRTIVQDSRGRMYFLTHGGLSVYDGTRFKNYHKENGLANELVNDILEITPDSLLLATNTDQLNTLVNGKIGVYKTANGFTPLINRLFRTKTGSIYAGADGGLFVLKDKVFHHLPLRNKKGEDIGRFLDKMIEWENYMLILPWNGNGLILYEPNTGQVKDVYTVEKTVDIVLDKRQQIWLSSPGYIKCVNMQALRKGKIKLDDVPPPFQQLKNRNGFLFFSRDSSCLLFGDNRLLKIDPGRNSQIIGEPQGLKIGTAVHVFEDREGLIWIATDGNGVVKWKGMDMKLLTSLGSIPIKAAALGKKEDTVMFFNLVNNKVFFIHNKGWYSQPVPVKAPAPHTLLMSGSQLYLHETDRSFLTKGSAASGFSDLQLLNRSDGVRYGTGVIDQHGNVIIHKNVDYARYFVSVIRGGKNIFDYPIDYTADNMTIDRQGRLWVITRTNHLLLFAIQPDRPGAYLKLLKNYSHQLKDLGMRSMTIDSSGNVWIGTRSNGVYRLQFKGLQIDSVRQFTTSDGLSDNFIYSITCDKNNTVWLGTQTGLDKISLKNGHYVIGNTGHTNNWFQTVTRVVSTTHNGVWAVTSEGALIHISKTETVAENFRPQLAFTDISVNGHAVDHSKRFNFKQNNFSFTVAAPSFIDERSIRYSYLLEGSGNPVWSEPGNVSVFNFINLAPGSYTLKIRCNYPEERYPPGFASYNFEILPPWWQTWWFRIAMGFLIIGSSALLVRFYYKRKMERQRLALEKRQAIEQERTRIATDMHDDLGAGLSRIKFLSETIGIKKQQHLPIEEDITKIREYSHQMIDKMGEIVWALNEKNDSVSDLLAYTRAYAVEYLSQNGIRCNLEMPEQFPSVFVSGEFRRNIFLSVKEILHNVVKHANADRVSMIFETGKQLAVHIIDNGKGFNREDIRPFSNGIYNIEKRMRSIGGSCEIRNGNGTTISLMAPYG